MPNLMPIIALYGVFWVFFYEYPFPTFYYAAIIRKIVQGRFPALLTTAFFSLAIIY